MELGAGVPCAKMRPSEQNKHDQNKDWQMMKLALGSALLVAVTQTLATGLGPTQGDVIIGRPFDILVQTRTEPGQGLADLCLQVRLQYGESQVPGVSLSTSLQSTGAGGEALLRVRSTEPINEPIVTLGLQVGCQTVFRRTYTLLADWVPVQAVAAADPAATALAAPALVPRPVANGAAATPAAADVVPAAPPPEQTPIRLSAPAARPAGLERLRSKAPPRMAQVPAAAPVAIATPAAPLAPPPTVAAGARLQLDPIPMPAQASPVAAVAPEGAVAGALPDAPLAEVGAAQNVLAAPEQELLALRAEQEQLRLALQSTQAQLLQMQTQAQAGVPAAWLYGLGALLLLLLGGALYAHRSGRLLLSRPAAATPAPWWETTLPDQAMQTKPGFEPSQPLIGPAGASAPAAVPVSAGLGSDAEATNQAARAEESTVQPMGGPPAVSGPALAPTTQAPAALPLDWLDVDAVAGLDVVEGRASMFVEVPVAVLDLRALIEVWQQAEFFESIAQGTQAMEVLKAFVAGHARASEAPYLRWLALAAQTGNASELAEATRFYENHFQRIAPSTEAILAQRGLEHNVALLQTLQAQWPQTGAAAVIERALASQPGEPGSVLTVRTLVAFDDLLVLTDVLDALLNPPIPMLDLGLAPEPEPTPHQPPTPASKPDPMSIDFDLGQLDWGDGKAAAKPDLDPSAQR